MTFSVALSLYLIVAGVTACHLFWMTKNETNEDLVTANYETASAAGLPSDEVVKTLWFNVWNHRCIAIWMIALLWPLRWGAILYLFLKIHK